MSLFPDLKAYWCLCRESHNDPSYHVKERGPSPPLHINKLQFGHLFGFFASPWWPPSAFTLSITLQPFPRQPPPTPWKHEPSHLKNHQSHSRLEIKLDVFFKKIIQALLKVKPFGCLLFESQKSDFSLLTWSWRFVVGVCCELWLCVSPSLSLGLQLLVTI